MQIMFRSDAELFHNLNFAASLHTEFRNGPWIFTIDPMYVSVEADLDPGVPLPAGNSPTDASAKKCHLTSATVTSKTIMITCHRTPGI